MGDTANQNNDDGSNGAGGDGNNSSNQNQNGGAGNDAGTGKKRNPLFADLPDDHPLVTAYTRLKDENGVLKPKAKLVDDAEEAKKTDAQKIADLQSKLDAQPQAVATALRDHLVELHSIDDKNRDLFLTGNTPELVLSQTKALLEMAGGGPKRGNQVRREGNTQQHSQGSDETRDFVRQITNRE
ncbi:scaffolding protein [Mycobacterium phage MOOREtheMARYer]|uniref:Scaffolding protein n=1 Tax=Mycobacterium phage MOOREtheMARYer TaxID=1647309 RepID=A0A0F6SJV3_9CAUD|nr:scaffolding protein [Mycobacterium phage MOOREtheMARYer]AKF14867.1 scaffolding protein [Mycobacterium phage MOOREtheMARYer]